MTPDSIGIVVMAKVALRICGPGESHLAFLYVINLSLMTPDSIGGLVVVWMASRICGIGASHLAFHSRAVCT